MCHFEITTLQKTPVRTQTKLIAENSEMNKLLFKLEPNKENLKLLKYIRAFINKVRQSLILLGFLKLNWHLH